MRIEVQTTDGTVAVEVAAIHEVRVPQGRVSVRLLPLNAIPNFTMEMTAEQFDQMVDELVTASSEMRQLALFDQFTDHQLAWYVACCRMPDPEDWVTRKEMLSDYMNGFTPTTMMTRGHLIDEVLSFNEDAISASRRVRDSLTEPPDHWPEYDEDM